jgi:hypothetical protein
MEQTLTLPLSLAKGEATIQHPAGVPFHVRIQLIRMSIWFFAVSYLGLQKISDHGILMIPPPKNDRHYATKRH